MESKKLIITPKSLCVKHKQKLQWQSMIRKFDQMNRNLSKQNNQLQYYQHTLDKQILNSMKQTISLKQQHAIVQYMLQRRQLNFYFEDNQRYYFNRVEVSQKNLLNISLIVQKYLEWQITIQSLYVGLNRNFSLPLSLNIIRQICLKYQYLSKIVLKNCQIGDKGIIFFKSCKFQVLSELRLLNNKITKEGIKTLASCQFNFLKDFVIRSNNIGNKGMHHLAKSKWPKLSTIIFSTCGTTVDAMRVLMKGSWPTLQSISTTMNFEEMAVSLGLKLFEKCFRLDLDRNQGEQTFWQIFISPRLYQQYNIHPQYDCSSVTYFRKQQYD